MYDFLGSGRVLLVQGRSLNIIAVLVAVWIPDKKQCKERRPSLGTLRRNKITMVKTGTAVKQHPAVAAAVWGCLLTLMHGEQKKTGK